MNQIKRIKQTKKFIKMLFTNKIQTWKQSQKISPKTAKQSVSGMRKNLKLDLIFENIYFE